MSFSLPSSSLRAGEGESSVTQDDHASNRLFLHPGFTNSSSYWADEALFSIPTTSSNSSSSSSSSPKYLLAATRSRTVGIPGYVSAFALDSTTGAITSQLFLLETTNSGGSANAVSPAPFGDEQYFAITDSSSNFVEVWKMDDTTAAVAAHLDLQSGPANVVWYS